MLGLGESKSLTSELLNISILRMPHFTILVAVYNAEAWLPQCLDSLLGQTDQSLQVICIDDCSTDGSAEVIRDYAARDARVEYLRTPENSGQAVARNLGLERAKGELTTMVDADDWLAPDALEIVWRCYTSSPEIDAVLFRLIYDEAGQQWENPWMMVPKAGGDRENVYAGKDACRFAVNWRFHGYYAVRTDLHRAIPYDTTCRLYSDDNTTRLHFLHSQRVMLSEGRYYYRQHPANSTRQLTRRRFDFLTANDHLRLLLEQNNADAETLSICEDYVWRNYVGLWRNRQRPCILSAEETKEVDEMLLTSFKAIRRSRLPWPTRLRPCYIPWPNYRFFCFWQRLLMLRKGAC